MTSSVPPGLRRLARTWSEAICAGDIERPPMLGEIEADRSPRPMTVRLRSIRSLGGQGCRALGTAIMYLYCEAREG